MATEPQAIFACHVCGEAAMRAEDPEQVEEFVACADDFAHLSSEQLKGHFKGLSLPFDRGLDVAVDQIVWCADAPGVP